MPLPNARKKRRTSEAAFYMYVCVRACPLRFLRGKKPTLARRRKCGKRSLLWRSLARLPPAAQFLSIRFELLSSEGKRKRASSIVAGNYFIIVCSFALFTRLRFFSRSAGSSIYTSARAREGGRIFCHPHPRPLYPREMKGLRAVFAPASVHVCIYI